jgi:hypothetical protein
MTTRARGLEPGGTWYSLFMITVGVVLLLLGLVLAIPILWSIGVVLVLVGAILWILGATGRAVGGRNHYW